MLSLHTHGKTENVQYCKEEKKTISFSKNMCIFFTTCRLSCIFFPCNLYIHVHVFLFSAFYSQDCCLQFLSALIMCYCVCVFRILIYRFYTRMLSLHTHGKTENVQYWKEEGKIQQTKGPANSAYRQKNPH